MKRSTTASKPAVKSVAKSNKTTKKTTDKSDSSMGPLYLNNKTNVSINQIENGYLVSESGYTGSGKNQQYFNKQYYSPTNPIAGIGSKVKFGGKK